MSKLDAIWRTQASTANSVADAVEATVARACRRAENATAPRARTESTTLRPAPSTSEEVERINVILPLDVLEAVDQRIAALGRKKISVSGNIEAALRELLATGEGDVAALECYRISARPRVSAA